MQVSDERNRLSNERKLTNDSLGKYNQCDIFLFESHNADDLASWKSLKCRFSCFFFDQTEHIAEIYRNILFFLQNFYGPNQIFAIQTMNIDQFNRLNNRAVEIYLHRIRHRVCHLKSMNISNCRTILKLNILTVHRHRLQYYLRRK